MTATQQDLFEPTSLTNEEKAMRWIHTKAGGMAMYIFIKEALRVKKRGFVKFSQRLLAERIRWLMKLERGPENEEDEFKINNDFIKTMALYAVEKCPELDGLFEFRERNAA